MHNTKSAHNLHLLMQLPYYPRLFSYCAYGTGLLEGGCECCWLVNAGRIQRADDTTESELHFLRSLLLQN